VCKQLKESHDKLEPKPKKSPWVFIAPADYESKVEKSVVETRLLTSLLNAANNFTPPDQVALQSVTAVAGALVSAQYLAGGIQALSKLFRTDYKLGYTSVDRKALFEQVLETTCSGTIQGNVERRLRLNAAALLNDIVPRLSSFAQNYDSRASQLPVDKAELQAERERVTAEKPANEEAAIQRRKTLAGLDANAKKLEQEGATLAKYKASAEAAKAYLKNLSSDATQDALVWGQSYLNAAGSMPTKEEGFVAIELSELYRLTVSLSVQDTSLRQSSVFSPDKLRYFATAELSYELLDPSGKPLSLVVNSYSTKPRDVELRNIAGENYKKEYGFVPTDSK
jgi:hypothetical protein